MKTVLIIALRNLLRQKRRNILLGIAIAFGAMILVIANSFSSGITDVMFNRIIKYVNGHVSMSYIRNGNMMNPVFPDSGRVWRAIRAAAPDLELAQEAIGIFGRAVGNGKADNVILVGIDFGIQMTPQDVEEYQANFKFIEGRFESLQDSTIPNPVCLAEQKAKYLNVKTGDALRIRFPDANNQTQSAQLTIVGVFKPANIFMAAPIFLNLKDLRRLANFGPHDLAAMQVNIKNPKENASKLADRIHDQLQPGLAVIPAELSAGSIRTQGVCLGFRNDTASHKLLTDKLRLAAGDSAVAFDREGVIASFGLSRALGIGPGDTLTMTWKSKFDLPQGARNVAIAAVADSSAPLPPAALLLNEKDFYDAFYRPWPAAITNAMAKLLPDSSLPFYAALAPEYILMPRVKTTMEVTKIIRESTRTRFRGIMFSVQSMYETASAVLKLEAALNIITLVAVFVLFFIILIGVINTLRMTIRERTREIGTVRAIGMQKKDVRNVFIFETFFLALFATLTGVAAAFLAMWGLGAIKIDAGDNPMGMLLISGHLHFVPSVVSIVVNILLILLMAVATAWFPARRAAKMPAAEALRHIE